MNPYTVLEIDNKSDINVIKKAYKQLARQYHPDRNPDPNAAEKFKEITDAYEYLCDEENKDFFDRNGRRLDEKPDRDDMGGMGGRGGFPFGGMHQDMMQQIFGMHGMAGMPGMGGFTNQQEMMEQMQIKKLHLNMKIDLTLEQIFTGVTQTINYQKVKVVNNNQMQVNDTVEITIPAGTKADTKIEIKNKGHELIMENGKQLRGSIFISISDKNDRVYERDIKKPENLICKQDLTFIQALCGFELILNHPSGKKLIIQYDKAIVNDKIYSVPDKGLPIVGSSMLGDLLLKFNIVYPKDISEEQKEKLAKLFNYTKYTIDEVKKTKLEEDKKYIFGTLYDYDENEDESEHEDNINPQFQQSVQCAQS